LIDFSLFGFFLSGSSSSDSTGLLDSVSAPVAGQGIAIVGVRKAFGSTQALRGVNFHARLGEIHAIVGGNGCGKSTLAKVISGVVPADSGQVSVLGLSPAAPHEARAAGIATVFQEVLVADECSVTENLYVGADTLWSRALSSQQKNDTAATLMRELAGMPIDPQTTVGSLPLNIKQWITIGRALLCKPRVLILDESSAALDLDSTERLFAKMRALRDGGCAVIIVTHRIAELIRVCDRATVLRDGVDVGVLEKTEITEKNLLRLMTGKAQSSEEAQSERPVQRLGAAVLRVDAMQVWPSARPVRCRLREGEILGVAGLDGQGQSEFVRMLAGVDPAMGSAPHVRDRQGAYVAIDGLRSAVSQGVCYVSGDRKREGIFANLSIYENLLMPLYRRKTRGGWLGLIAWPGLEGVFDWEVERLAVRMGERSNKITSLSGGNQQKVLIGRAFALSPDILVLNDPARGIDVGAKAELYRHLREFAAQGKSVIYLSSEIEEFVGFCSRVLVFRNGSIFDEFSGPQIHPTPILEAMFGQTRADQVHPVDADPAFEEEPMKIVEFGADAATPQPGDADNWKRRSSPYPGFNQKPHQADAPSLEAMHGARSGSGASDAASIAPVVLSASERPKIKIMEFNTGGLATGRAAPGATATVRTDPAAVSAAKSVMKIVEFDDLTASSARSSATSGRSAIKIVEYGEAAKGGRS
jgi:ribose transport system ATP-binding protein